jgi:hypothetical protein
MPKCDGNHSLLAPCEDSECWQRDDGPKRKLVAHGFTMVGWAMEYESEIPANDPKAVWNDAMNRSHAESTTVIETRQRLMRVHELGDPCLFCDVASGKTKATPPGA